MGFPSDDELKNVAQMVAKDYAIAPGDIFRHYKGDLYVVVCVSVKEDTHEALITYRSNKDGAIWTRTVTNFLETLSHAANNPAGPCPRFRREED